jgi:hypothetical protein
MHSPKRAETLEDIYAKASKSAILAAFEWLNTLLQSKIFMSKKLTDTMCLAAPDFSSEEFKPIQINDFLCANIKNQQRIPLLIKKSGTNAVGLLNAGNFGRGLFCSFVFQKTIAISLNKRREFI